MTGTNDPTTLAEVDKVLRDHAKALRELTDAIDLIAPDESPEREVVWLLAQAQEAVQRATAVIDGTAPPRVEWADMPAQLELMAESINRGERPNHGFERLLYSIARVWEQIGPGDDVWDACVDILALRERIAEGRLPDRYTETAAS